MSRAHGEGSIFQRRDGRWQASVMIAGRRYTVYGVTRREATTKLAEVKQRIGITPPDPGRRTLSDLIDEWLRAAAPSLRPKTLYTYRRICELHILPTLGQVRLTKLDPLRIERVLSTIPARRQAQHAFMCLHRACVFGVRWRWLSENVMDRVQRPVHRARRPTLWTKDQLCAFLEGSQEHWLYPLFLLVLASGCRLGELLALRWSDVDLDAGTITIERTLQRVCGQVLVGQPKTSAGKRTVTLPTEAIQVLRQQYGRLVLSGLATDLVFPNHRGGPLHHSTVEHALQRVCVRLGIPPMTPHGLRHLHASLLLAQGLPIPVVSQRLGHANAAITMSGYAHAISKDDTAATQAIERAIGERR